MTTLYNGDCLVEMAKIPDKSVDMEEQWRDIKGYEGKYQISNNGRVRSKNKILKLQINHKGYSVVRLSKGRKNKQSFLVHRLVGLYFLPNPNGLPQINHIDSDKTNNTARNLEWCTNLYNQRHSWANGRHFVRSGKEKRVAVYRNGNYIGSYDSITKSIISIGLSLTDKSNISNVLMGKRKVCKGYVWKYL